MAAYNTFNVLKPMIKETYAGKLKPKFKKIKKPQLPKTGK